MTPEAKARIDIDKLLTQAGWHVCGMGDFDIPRLARLDSDLGDADKAKVIEASGGHSLRDLARGIVEALNTEDVIAAQAAIQAAARPFSDPALRTLVLQLRQKADQIIDIVTKDALISATFAEGSDRAKELLQSFEAFIAQHKDEITALQILYSRPTRAPLKFEDVKDLADALHAPPHLIDEGAL